MIVISLCKFSKAWDAAESSQSSLYREDSSSELTASRKEAQLKGRVSDVSKKKSLTLVITFEVFLPFLTDTSIIPKHITTIPKEDDLVTLMLKITLQTCSYQKFCVSLSETHLVPDSDINNLF